MQIVIRNDDGTEQDVTEAVTAAVRVAWPVVRDAVSDLYDVIYPVKVIDASRVECPKCEHSFATRPTECPFNDCPAIAESPFIADTGEEYR